MERNAPGFRWLLPTKCPSGANLKGRPTKADLMISFGKCPELELSTAAIPSASLISKSQF